MAVHPFNITSNNNIQTNNEAKSKPKVDGPINFYEIMYRGFEPGALNKWYETTELKLCPICETNQEKNIDYVSQPSNFNNQPQPIQNNYLPSSSDFQYQTQKVSSMQPQIHPLLQETKIPIQINQYTPIGLKRKESEPNYILESESHKRLKSPGPQKQQDFMAATEMDRLCKIDARTFYRSLKDHMVSSVDENGSTLLHHAVEMKKPKHIEILLSCNCNINHKNFEGNTALHIAFQKHHFKLIENLIKNDTDCWIKNNQGLTPMECTELKSDQKRTIHTIIQEHIERKKSKESTSNNISIDLTKSINSNVQTQQNNFSPYQWQMNPSSIFFPQQNRLVQWPTHSNIEQPQQQLSRALPVGQTPINTSQIKFPTKEMYSHTETSSSAEEEDDLPKRH